MLIHFHVTTWFLGIVLFVISYIFAVRKNEKAQKITHMIVRLFYLFIIGTGGYLLHLYQYFGTAVVKAVFGLVVIVLMELILSKAKKGESTTLLWVFFIIAFVLVLFFGYVVLG